MWEHAYYLKHQNKKANYIKDYFNVINWEKVDELYTNALGK
jgi:Fe-Mn family superoxide dismutase